MRWWTLLALLLAWAGIVAWRRRQDDGGAGDQPRGRPRDARPDNDIDRDELEQAEREVRDLETDVRGRPLDDHIGDDWGPGTPKPPYV